MKILSSEEKLNNHITSYFSARVRPWIEHALENTEIAALHEYAHTVSVHRMFINDHGPLHMKQVAANALNIAGLLHTAGIALSLEKEGIGNYEDSQIVLFFAAFLHDVGMAITRDQHELLALDIAAPFIQYYLKKIYPHQVKKQIKLRMLINECIVGHMGTYHIFSEEAGIILIADGCDMQKTRATIPMHHENRPQVGDMHKYSAFAVEDIQIKAGERPVHINVLMNESIGLFQVEAVLFPKLDVSPVKKYIILTIAIANREIKRYL